MTITLVGTVKNANGTTGQRSVTLDATDVLPGDVMIWAGGTNAAYARGTNGNESRSGSQFVYEINGTGNNGNTQRVTLFAYVCDGSEESQTFYSAGTNFNGSLSVAIFRPSPGYKIDIYGAEATYHQITSGTSATATLTAGTTVQAGAIGIYAARASTGMNSGTDSIAWDGGADSTTDWEYDLAAFKFDYKIYTATTAPTVTVKNMGTADKAHLFSVLQEIPAGGVLPYL